MKINNSNERYSNYIAGILVFVLLFIFMGFLIGCWGSCSYEQEGPLVVFPLNLDFDTGDISDEPAAQSPETWELDTVAGTMTILDAGFYNSSGDLLVNMTSGTGQFPLCIPDDEGYYFNFTVETHGGYTPSDFNPHNYIEICQFKWSNTYYKYRLYYDYLDWGTEPIDFGICTEIWEGIIPVINDAEHTLKRLDCSVLPPSWVETDCIIFDSNHEPDGSGTLNKWVTVQLKSSWQGCMLQSQRFVFKDTWYCLNTEPGDLEILPYGIKASSFVLDLCYKYGDTISSIFVYSKGGYSPDDDDNITLSQIKTGSVYSLYKLSDVDWIEYDEVSDYDLFIEDNGITLAEFTDFVGCGKSLFVGTVSFGDNIIQIDELNVETDLVPGSYMKFSSNHVPVGVCPDKTLGKEVDVTFESKWTGCGQVSQEFTLMLVHKNNISGVPNSRNFIAS